MLYSTASCQVLSNYRSFEGLVYLPLKGQAIFDPENNQPSVLYMETLWAETESLVQRLATGCKVRGSDPDGARFSAPVQRGPEANPASYTKSRG
jgi:hypothetical protein